MSDDQNNRDFGRLDVHEVKIENIYNSLSRMENAIEKQSVAITTMSESLVKVAAQQEVISALSTDSRIHSDRLYDLEKRMTVMDNTVEPLTVDVKKTVDRQKTNTMVIGVVIFVASVLTTALVNAGIKFFLGA